MRGRAAAGPPPAPVEELDLRLAGLERMRTVGLIAETTYQQQRARLLAAIAAATPPPEALPDGARGEPARRSVDGPAIDAPPPEPALPPFGRRGAEAPERRSRAASIATGDAVEARLAAAALAAERAQARTLRIVAAITAVTVAAAAVAGLATLHRGAVHVGAGLTAAVHPTVTALPSDPAMAAFVLEARAFVESHRGLHFVADVPVVPLADQPFDHILGADRPGTVGGGAQAAQDAETAELVALGVVPRTDLGQASRTAATAGIEGFYDPAQRSLYVRGTTLTPYRKEVIVHELTHALQDQAFSLRFPNQPHTEADLAYRALVEGDATRIQQQFRAAEPAADQAAADAETAGAGTAADLDRVPRGLLELGAFPYANGRTFTEALVGSGGQAALDRAFGSPPTTSAQILDPGRYLAGTGAVAVPAPAADGALLDDGVLGALTLSVIGEQALTRHTVGLEAVHDAVTLWGGDRYVAWSGGGRTCVRDVAAPVSAAAASRFAAAEGALMAAIGGRVSVADGGVVTATLCA